MKMNIENATPLPWTLIDADYNGITTITGGENPNAQQLIFEPCRMEQANAALIVESVNQHMALVAVSEIANKIECGALSARDSIAMQAALAALESIRKEGK